jgi:transposase
LAKVTIEQLASPRRTPELVDARELIGGVAIERWGIQVKALAEALGKSREGVSKWVRRAARRRSEDGAFARRMEALDRRLADGVK